MKDKIKGWKLLILNYKRLSLLQSIVIIVSLFVLCFIIHKDILPEYPKGVHRWSQSDHYAISLGYVENNLNLFKPQTYLLNPPISTPEVDTLQGITRVDFPLFHYVVGVTMKVTSCTEPIVQRLISLLISIIGLFFLYKLVFRQTKSFWSAFIVVAFVVGLPVFLYYQCNFLPSVPGMSLCLIGYYFYFKYLEDKQRSNFIWSILFLWLAVLFRLPLAIPLIAVACQQTLGYIRNRKINWQEILVFLIAFMSLGLYYIYNCYLGSKYGSIFLNTILPPSSISDFKEWLTIIHEHQYPTHTNDRIQIFVRILFLNMVAYLIYSVIKKQSLTKFQKQIILQTGIAFLGGLIYFVLMISQFKYHDYYFIDTFYTAFILLMVFCITFIKWNWKWLNIILKVFLLVLICFIIDKSNKAQKKRQVFTPSQNGYYIDRYIDDIQYLIDKNGISKEEIIYVMDDQMQANVAFCKLKRNGFCWQGFDNNNKWLSRANYVFSTRKSLINTLYKYDYTLQFKLDELDKYGTVVMLKEADSVKNNQILADQNDNSLDATYILNFDNIPLSVWGIKDAIFEYDNTDKRNVAHVTSNGEYLSALSLPLSELNGGKTYQDIFVEIDMLSLKPGKKVALIACIDRNDKLYLYDRIDIDLDNIDEWKTMTYFFHFETLNEETDKFIMYLWNFNEAEFYYDNFVVKLH